MNVLLDTNIIIPLEDTSKLLDSSFAELRRLSAEQHHCLYIHPIQIQDINRDNNSVRRSIVLSRLNQYSQIENPPILSEQDCKELSLTQSNENDKVDNNLLFALYRGAVHVLVTNDEGIHKKAIKLELQNNVYRLEQFLILLRRYADTTHSHGYTGVKELYLYEINKKQPFFDSLRQSYSEFDTWYQKCAEEKRKCWCIENTNGEVIAICIYKKENEIQLTDNGSNIKGSILKLCTFKVAIEARGQKLGERLLYIAFDYCIKNNLDWVYLHTAGKEQQTLVGLCLDYGFYLLGKYMQDDVYIKPMKLGNDIHDSLMSLIRYYPFFYTDDMVRKFIIPIRPKYHEELFPDYSVLKGSLFEKDQNLSTSQGNTIKKAYLCHAKTKAIRRGDIILFYRSHDRKSIQCMGIVEDVHLSKDINEVFPLIAKRTVFNKDDITKILRKETLVILFRYIALNKEIFLKSLTSAGINGSIQSIRKISNSQYNAITNG